MVCSIPNGLIISIPPISVILYILFNLSLNVLVLYLIDCFVDFRSIILPLVRALPTVPSPKYTLYLLFVSSSKKYTLAVEFIEVVSFATE